MISVHYSRWPVVLGRVSSLSIAIAIVLFLSVPPAAFAQ